MSQPAGVRIPIDNVGPSALIDTHSWLSMMQMLLEVSTMYLSKLPAYRAGNTFYRIVTTFTGSPTDFLLYLPRLV